MKILDKYVARNFLTGYVISFCILIGLRIIIDLFINLDEFTENSGLGAYSVIKNIFVFYGLNVTLYFRDFAGMIMVVAASFSLGKMTRQNELVAIMASGISLKRVIAPIIILCIILSGVLIIDQEFLIPSMSDKLVRSQDDVPGEESYSIWFISDGQGSLICSRRFDVKTSTLHNPTILIRQMRSAGIWSVTGRIDAKEAVPDPNGKGWLLTDGVFISKDSQAGIEEIRFCETDITARDLPVRSKSENKSLLSSAQLSILARQGGKVKDLAQLYSQKHFRITEPIINLVMLMVCLPILVCRDPKTMKSAVMMSFLIVGACFIVNFVCKMLSTEQIIFNRVIPELWAWLSIIIFLPIALIEFDSMKT